MAGAMNIVGVGVLHGSVWPCVGVLPGRGKEYGDLLLCLSELDVVFGAVVLASAREFQFTGAVRY